MHRTMGAACGQSFLACPLSSGGGDTATYKKSFLFALCVSSCSDHGQRTLVARGSAAAGTESNGAVVHLCDARSVVRREGAPAEKQLECQAAQRPDVHLAKGEWKNWRVGQPMEVFGNGSGAATS